jgi:hypothetical protein
MSFDIVCSSAFCAAAERAAVAVAAAVWSIKVQEVEEHQVDLREGCN